MKKDAGVVQNALRHMTRKYVQFLVNLNRFIILFGECGFRLSDERRNEMIPLYNIGGLNDALNTPVRLGVAGDSIYKFFLRLPEIFKPSENVLIQPRCESATSAELQRIFALTLCMNDWVVQDDLAEIYTSRRILKLILESNESNHIAMKIFDYCFSKGDIQRVNPENLRELVPLFDDFEARFFPDLMLIVRGNLEWFGYTREVVRALRESRVPSGVAYAAARETGILTSNVSANRARNVHWTQQQLQASLGNMSLLTDLRRGMERRREIVLPIYSRYFETRGYRWARETGSS